MLCCTKTAIFCSLWMNYEKLPFWFLMGRHLMKEVNNFLFWCHNSKIVAVKWPGKVEEYEKAWMLATLLTNFIVTCILFIVFILITYFNFYFSFIYWCEQSLNFIVYGNINTNPYKWPNQMKLVSIGVFEAISEVYCYITQYITVSGQK